MQVIQSRDLGIRREAAQRAEVAIHHPEARPPKHTKLAAPLALRTLERKAMNEPRRSKNGKARG